MSFDKILKKGDTENLGNTFSIITLLVSIVSGVSAFCAIFAFMKNQKKETQTEGAEQAWLRSDLDYLRRSIDNVALDLKDIQRQQSATKESLIREDERINNMEEKIHEIDNRIHALEQK